MRALASLTAVLVMALSVALPLSGHTSATCDRPEKVVRINFDRDRYPNIARHHEWAAKHGWGRVLQINRSGSDRRRSKLMAQAPPARKGFDRDEYPPAVARETWRAHIAFVPSSENRSAGASLGNRLRKYCDGVRFREVFR